MPASDFDALVDEGNAAPTEGWDFSWFAGRAREGRPAWRYVHVLSARMATAHASLDLQTGGGEVTAEALGAARHTPPVLCATESWEPNLELARTRLAPFGATVIQAPDDGPIPFADNTFDLVSCRHPVVTPWTEIARVLQPSGVHISQQVGNGSVRELSEAILGPYDIGDARDPDRLADEARAAGLDVVRLERASLPMEFDDIAAVIVFLRKVIWIVPGFTVDAYREPLERVHRQIVKDGPFRATSERFLIECRKP